MYSAAHKRPICDRNDRARDQLQCSSVWTRPPPIIDLRYASGKAADCQIAANFLVICSSRNCAAEYKSSDGGIPAREGEREKAVATAYPQYGAIIRFDNSRYYVIK